MDSVALYLSRDYTLSIIQSLKESREKCEADGRRIMAEKYKQIEDIMVAQFKIAQSIADNIEENGGEYKL